MVVDDYRNLNAFVNERLNSWSSLIVAWLIRVVGTPPNKYIHPPLIYQERSYIYFRHADLIIRAMNYKYHSRSTSDSEQYHYVQCMVHRALESLRTDANQKVDLIMSLASKLHGIHNMF